MKMKKHSLLWKHTLPVWIYLFIFVFNSQATVEVRSTHKTTADGLANNSICYLFQDSKGFIWMGTLNGLSRYDGNSFVNFQPTNESKSDRISLLTNHVRTISEDRNGFLWIETSGEFFNCYDLKKDCFVDFTGCGEHRQHYDRKTEAPNGDVWLWNNRNGCRRITCRDGVFSSVSFKKSLGNLPSDNVTYIYPDAQGRIWIGTDRGVVLAAGSQTLPIDGQNAYAALSFGQSTFFLSADGVISRKESSKPAVAVAQLSKGEKNPVIYGTLCLQSDWVIFTSDGGYLFDMKTHRISRPPEMDIPRGRVLTDNRGNFWIHNHTGRVWYVNAATRAIKTFRLSLPDKLNYVDIERYHVVHDSRGIIWISTYGNGLFAYNTATDELQHFDFQIDGFSHITPKPSPCPTAPTPCE